jgi:hypothetical protein
MESAVFKEFTAVFETILEWTILKRCQDDRGTQRNAGVFQKGDIGALQSWLEAVNRLFRLPQFLPLKASSNLQILTSSLEDTASCRSFKPTVYYIVTEHYKIIG